MRSDSSFPGPDSTMESLRQLFEQMNGMVGATGWQLDSGGMIHDPCPFAHGLTNSRILDFIQEGEQLRLELGDWAAFMLANEDLYWNTLKALGRL